MNCPVFVLVSNRNPDLWNASVAVLNTIRVGFPESKIVIFTNGLSRERGDEVARIASNLGGRPLLLGLINRCSHPEWIESLVENENFPFWICDTDVIFYGRVEGAESSFRDFPMAGAYTPRFVCPYTKTFTMDRLHTALMWLDPKAIRDKLAQWKRDKLVNFPLTNAFDEITRSLLIRQQVFVDEGQPHFHDTTSQLYHAIGGKAFNEQILDSYAHVQCGTYSDLVDPTGGFTSRQRVIYDNPELGRGLWRKHADFYAANSWGD